MAQKLNLDELKSRADDIYGTYSGNFAGKPRATRDLTMIEGLIKDLATLIEETRTMMNGDRNPAVLSFLETATDNLERYRNEREQIAEAQRNPFAVEGATLANRANRVFDMYRRHYAGKDRGTRDRMLLNEMVQDLEKTQAAMRDLVDRGAQGSRQDLETVSAQLRMYREEITNIAHAQTSGSEQDVAGRLATLANSQFSLYTDHFAGKGRTSRRPATLERMIANLEEYQAEMRELADDGFRSDANRSNMGIISRNLEMYRTELTEITKAQQSASPEDLAGILGGAANEVFEVYRREFAGKDRRTRDLALIGLMCDQLRDIALQMRKLAETHDLDVNNKNLLIVEERWGTYENEYKQIEQAQGPEGTRAKTTGLA